MPKLFASIDIGSNAVRLLFASVYENQNRTVVAEKATLVRIPVRLGMDVFETGIISEYRESLLIKTLNAYKLLIEVYQPLGVRVCATAAMREAVNSKQVLDRIIETTGFCVDVIDGQEEASIISACNDFSFDSLADHILYVDVGGGSTEISLFSENRYVASKSFNIGTIRYLNGKIDDGEWEIMKGWIRSMIPEHKKTICIGSGGNINKLVKLFGRHDKDYISRKLLKGAYKTLASLSTEERGSQYGMRSDRADVIVPAAEIFLRIMKWGNINRVIAPKFGLADGLAIEQYKEYVTKT